ncbi:MAG TPA: CpsD/CapB family tyrosine-protein kinase [Nitrolancea sp.]|nr:CpsD/CapB family tyrosine-protein kinase [Nitrolancea sp.]
MSQTQDRTSEGQRPATATNLTLLANPASATAEAYRSLRASVKFAGVKPSVRSVLIADAGSNGQHNAVAANLAAALALAGDATILIDADLRRPALHEQFGVPNRAGLSDWLAAGDSTAPIPLVPTSIDGLSLLTAGTASGNGTFGIAPVDYLSSDHFVDLLHRLSDTAEYLVFDAPSLAEVGDALTIAARVDAVLLLVRSGRTKRTAAQKAKESLDRVGARLLGAVLTDSGGGLRLW